MDLGRADLHVWTVALEGPSPVTDIFSADELARAARFVRDEDRDAFLRARGALRALLARYLDADPRAIELAPGTWGKPALTGKLAATDITFNLSHSGGLALIAIARDRAVGIDVERLRAMPEAAAIARRMLGAAPAAALDGLAPAARDRAFLRLWTAHEACIKALGLALAVASDALRIGVAGGDPVCEWADPRAAPYGLAVEPLEIAPGYVAALALAPRTPPSAEPADRAVRVLRFAVE